MENINDAFNTLFWVRLNFESLSTEFKVIHNFEISRLFLNLKSPSNDNLISNAVRERLSDILCGDFIKTCPSNITTYLAPTLRLLFTTSSVNCCFVYEVLKSCNCKFKAVKMFTIINCCWKNICQLIFNQISNRNHVFFNKYTRSVLKVSVTIAINKKKFNAASFNGFHNVPREIKTLLFSKNYLLFLFCKATHILLREDDDKFNFITCNISNLRLPYRDKNEKCRTSMMMMLLAKNNMLRILWQKSWLRQHICS